MAAVHPRFVVAVGPIAAYSEGPHSVKGEHVRSVVAVPGSDSYAVVPQGVRGVHTRSAKSVGATLSYWSESHGVNGSHPAKADVRTRTQIPGKGGGKNTNVCGIHDPTRAERWADRRRPKPFRG